MRKNPNSLITTSVLLLALVALAAPNKASADGDGSGDAGEKITRGASPKNAPSTPASDAAKTFDNAVPQKMEDEYSDKEGMAGLPQDSSFTIDDAAPPAANHQNGCNADQFFNFVCGVKSAPHSQNVIAHDLLANAKGEAANYDKDLILPALFYGENSDGKGPFYSDPEIVKTCGKLFPKEEKRRNIPQIDDLEQCAAGTAAYRKYVNQLIAKESDDFKLARGLFEKTKSIAIEMMQERLAEAYSVAYKADLDAYLQSDLGRQMLKTTDEQNIRDHFNLFMRASLGRMLQALQSTEFNDKDILGVCGFDQVDVLVVRRKDKGPLVTVCPGMLKGLSTAGGKYQNAEAQASLMSLLARAVGQSLDSCELNRMSVGVQPAVNLGDLLAPQRACLAGRAKGKVYSVGSGTVGTESGEPNSFSRKVLYDDWLKTAQSSGGLALDDEQAPHCAAPLNQGQLDGSLPVTGRREQTNSLSAQVLADRVMAKWFAEQKFQRGGGSAQNAAVRAAFAPYCAQKFKDNGTNVDAKTFLNEYVARDPYLRQALGCALKQTPARKQKKAALADAQTLFSDPCSIESSLVTGFYKYVHGFALNPGWNVTPEEKTLADATADTLNEGLKKAQAQQSAKDLKMPPAPSAAPAATPASVLSPAVPPASDASVSLDHSKQPSENARDGTKNSFPLKVDKKDDTSPLAIPSGSKTANGVRLMHRCFSAAMSGDPAENTSDAVRQYCVDVKHRDDARKDALKDAQSQCAEITQLDFTKKQNIHACEQMQQGTIDINLWKEPRLVEKDGFTFQFACQSRCLCPHSRDASDMTCYYGEAGFLGVVKGDVPEPTPEPGTDDQRYIQYSKRWATEQAALGESSPGVFAAGKGCLQQMLPPLSVEATCNKSNKTSGSFDIRPQPSVVYDSKIPGAEAIQFACDIDCSCDDHSCKLAPLKAIAMNEDKNFVAAPLSTKSAVNTVRVSGYLDGISQDDMIQAAKKWEDAHPNKRHPEENAPQAPKATPVTAADSELKADQGSNYLNKDYMDNRWIARSKTEEVAKNACGMAVTRVALAYPKKPMREFFCPNGINGMQSFKIPGKASPFLIRYNGWNEDFQYECNYKCYDPMCIWGHTRDDLNKNEGPKTECVYVRHVPGENKVTTQPEYEAARNQDRDIAAAEMRDTCARELPWKTQDVPACQGKTSGTVKMVSRQHQTLPTDLTGKLAGGLLFTCNYVCDCGPPRLSDKKKQNYYPACTIPEHGGANILTDTMWTDEVKARLKGPTKR